MPLSFAQIYSLYRDVKPPGMDLGGFSRYANEATGTREFDEGQRGLVGRLAGQADYWIDEALNQTPLPEWGGAVGKKAFEMFGGTPETGEMYGRELPRGVVDFLPLILSGPGGLLTKGAGMAGSAALSGLNAYGKTGDVTQGAVAAATVPAMMGGAHLAGQAAVKMGLTNPVSRILGEATLAGNPTGRLMEQKFLESVSSKASNYVAQNVGASATGELLAYGNDAIRAGSINPWEGQGYDRFLGEALGNLPWMLTDVKGLVKKGPHAFSEPTPLKRQLPTDKVPVLDTSAISDVDARVMNLDLLRFRELANAAREADPAKKALMEQEAQQRWTSGHYLAALEKGATPDQLVPLVKPVDWKNVLPEMEPVQLAAVELEKLRSKYPANRQWGDTLNKGDEAPWSSDVTAQEAIALGVIQPGQEAKWNAEMRPSQRVRAARRVMERKTAELLATLKPVKLQEVNDTNLELHLNETNVLRQVAERPPVQKEEIVQRVEEEVKRTGDDPVEVLARRVAIEKNKALAQAQKKLAELKKFEDELDVKVTRDQEKKKLAETQKNAKMESIRLRLGEDFASEHPVLKDVADFVIKKGDEAVEMLWAKNRQAVQSGKMSVEEFKKKVFGGTETAQKRAALPELREHKIQSKHEGAEDAQLEAQRRNAERTDDEAEDFDFSAYDRTNTGDKAWVVQRRFFTEEARAKWATREREKASEQAERVKDEIAVLKPVVAKLSEKVEGGKKDAQKLVLDELTDALKNHILEAQAEGKNLFEDLSPEEKTAFRKAAKKDGAPEVVGKLAEVLARWNVDKAERAAQDTTGWSPRDTGQGLSPVGALGTQHDPELVRINRELFEIDPDWQRKFVTRHVVDGNGRRTRMIPSPVVSDKIRALIEERNKVAERQPVGAQRTIPAGGPFRFKLGDVFESRNGKDMWVGDKRVSESQVVPSQKFWDVVQKRVARSEYAMWQEQVPGAFGAKGVDVEYLGRELAKRPQVRTKVIFLNKKLAGKDNEIARIEHELDTLNPDWRTGAPERSERERQLGAEWDLLQRQARDLQESRTGSEPWTGRGVADPHSPEVLRGEKELAPGVRAVEAGDLMVNVPLPVEDQATLDAGGVLRQSSRTGVDYDTDPENIVTPKFQSLHYTGPEGANQLGFARFAVFEYQPGSKLPDGRVADKAEKVMEVWEVQSDWAGAAQRQLDFNLDSLKRARVDRAALAAEPIAPFLRAGGERDGWMFHGEYAETPEKAELLKAKRVAEWDAAVTKLEGEVATAQKKVDSQPALLNHWESLTYKSILDHALKSGADYVYLTDAESGMMTEGHDTLGQHETLYEATPENVAKAQKMVELHKTYPGKVQGMFIKDLQKLANGETLRLLGQSPIKGLTATSEIKVVSQEKGMRAAYDERGPNILTKLTGEKPVKAVMGLHEKAMREVPVDQAGNQVPERDMQRYEMRAIGSPVFDNKKDNTGSLFSLTSLRADRLLKNVDTFPLIGATKSKGFDIETRQLPEDPELGGGDTNQVVAKKNGEVVGLIDLREESNRTALHMFPDIVQPTDKVFRVSSIGVLSDFQNQGLGKDLYLRALANHPDAWQYNSQAYPPARRVLESLQKEGLIELHTKPTIGNDLGIHIKRITPKGLEFVERNLASSQRADTDIAPAGKKDNLIPSLDEALEQLLENSGFSPGQRSLYRSALVSSLEWMSTPGVQMGILKSDEYLGMANMGKQNIVWLAEVVGRMDPKDAAQALIGLQATMAHEAGGHRWEAALNQGLLDGTPVEAPLRKFQEFVYNEANKQQVAELMTVMHDLMPKEVQDTNFWKSVWSDTVYSTAPQEAFANIMAAAALMRMKRGGPHGLLMPSEARGMLKAVNRDLGEVFRAIEGATWLRDQEVPKAYRDAIDGILELHQATTDVMRSDLRILERYEKMMALAGEGAWEYNQFILMPGKRAREGLVGAKRETDKYLEGPVEKVLRDTLQTMFGEDAPQMNMLKSIAADHVTEQRRLLVNSTVPFVGGKGPSGEPLARSAQAKMHNSVKKEANEKLNSFISKSMQWLNQGGRMPAQVFDEKALLQAPNTMWPPKAAKQDDLKTLYKALTPSEKQAYWHEVAATRESGKIITRQMVESKKVKGRWLNAQIFSSALGEEHYFKSPDLSLKFTEAMDAAVSGDPGQALLGTKQLEALRQHVLALNPEKGQESFELAMRTHLVMQDHAKRIQETFDQFPNHWSLIRSGEWHITAYDSSGKAVKSDNLDSRADIEAWKAEQREIFGSNTLKFSEPTRSGKRGEFDYKNDGLLVMLEKADEKLRTALSAIEMPEDLKATVMESLAESSVVANVSAMQGASNPTITQGMKGLKEGHRRAIPGDTDLVHSQQVFRELASRIIATDMMRAKMDWALQNPRLKDVPDSVVRFKHMMKNYMKPDSQLTNAIARTTAVMYLGGNVPASILNGLDGVMTIYPELLAQGVKPAKAAAMLARSSAEMMKYSYQLAKESIGFDKTHVATGKIKDKDTRMLFERANEDAILTFGHANDMFDQTADSSLDLSTYSRKGEFAKAATKAKSFAGSLANFSLKAFVATEHYNKRLALDLGFKLAKEKMGSSYNFEDAYQMAKEFMRNATFATGRVNRTLAHGSSGPLGAAAFSLSSYTLGSMWNLIRYVKHWKGNEYLDLSPAERTAARNAALAALGTKMAAAGVLGMPFVGIALKLIEELTGEEYEGKLWSKLGQILEEDEQDMGGGLTSVIMSGAANAFLAKSGLPIDVANRMSFNGILGLSSYSGFDPKGMFGPTGGLVSSALTGLKSAQDGKLGEALGHVSPPALRRAIKLMINGGEIDAGDGGTMPASLSEKAAYAVGFDPQRLAKLRRFQSVKRQESFSIEAMNQREASEVLELLESDPSGMGARRKVLEMSNDSGEPRQQIATRVAKAAANAVYPEDVRLGLPKKSAEHLMEVAKLMGVTVPEAQQVARSQYMQNVMQMLGVRPSRTPRMAGQWDEQAEEQPFSPFLSPSK